MQGLRVQSLVRELRSHMPFSLKNNKNDKNKMPVLMRWISGYKARYFEPEWPSHSGLSLTLFFPSFLSSSIPCFLPAILNFSLWKFFVCLFVFTMEVLTQIQNGGIMDFLFIREYSGWSDGPIIYLQQLPSSCGHFFFSYVPFDSCVRFGTLTNKCKGWIRWIEDLLGKILDGKVEESRGC